MLAPNLIPAVAVEAAATQGLVNGWVLGMIMGALPRLLGTRCGLTGTVLFADDNGKADGCWHSVTALNSGVALITSAPTICGTYRSVKRDTTRVWLKRPESGGVQTTEG